MIRALIFDFDGTLVYISNWSDYWSGIFRESIKKMGGVFEGDFESIYNFSIGSYNEKAQMLMRWGVNASVEKFLKTMGWVDHDERLNLLNESETGFYPDVARFLRFIRLKKRGFGIVTYSMKEIVDEYFLRFYRDLTYDAIYDRRLSLLTKHWKPSPLPIIKISSQLQAKPDQVMVIGDREMDIESGFLSGSKTALIQRDDGERNDEVLENLRQKNIRPDFVVNSLDELREFMGDSDI